MGYAYIELRRFDQAIVAGKKAQRQNPSFMIPYRCLASAFAHIGRDVEAREAAAPVRPVPARQQRAPRCLQRLRWKPAEPSRPLIPQSKVAEAEGTGKNITGTHARYGRPARAHSGDP